MEKPVKPKNKLLKFLPKAVSAVSVTFQNPPFSPTRDKKRLDIIVPIKHKTHFGKAFSGQILSMVPAEARRNPKNSSFEAQEPTSPKVSCMGQIKQKKKMKRDKIKKEKHVSLPKDFRPALDEVKKKKVLKIRNVFSSAKPPGRKSDASDYKSTLPDRAPSLSQMKRFASGRDSLTAFDWIIPGDADNGNYFSDEERDQGEERDQFMIPFSAPILVGGDNGITLKPRTEINLWKRRTMAQPRPLQVD